MHGGAAQHRQMQQPYQKGDGNDCCCQHSVTPLLLQGQDLVKGKRSNERGESGCQSKIAGGKPWWVLLVCNVANGLWHYQLTWRRLGGVRLIQLEGSAVFCFILPQCGC